jgi:hypothetical protein
MCLRRPDGSGCWLQIGMNRKRRAVSKPPPWTATPLDRLLLAISLTRISRHAPDSSGTTAANMADNPV